jgi:hypothetical protein
MSIAGFLGCLLFDFDEQAEKFGHFFAFRLSIFGLGWLDRSPSCAVLTHGTSSKCHKADQKAALQSKRAITLFG